MTRIRAWVLTDVANDIWLDSFSIDNHLLGLPTPHSWSVRKRTLRGGLRDGVDLVEIANGPLSLSVLPTRGMGIWRGDYRGIYLGWRAPVLGPVHPRNVPLDHRQGLGWLLGFDELLCRCGLASNGPPGEDGGTDQQGHKWSMPLTLHGRIANRPAHHVEVQVSLDPPYELRIVGQVAESALFFPNLQLTTTLTTVPGSNRFVVHDVVENHGAQQVEMQMLYHLNLGPPVLEAGSRFVLPFREMCPLTERAAEDLDTHETYAGPHAGFAEQVYVYQPLGDAGGKCVALLSNRGTDRGLAMRWNLNELPCFTLWRNTGALEDGYVTGLEPGTNYPNFRGFERKQGRVRCLAPGGKWEAKWSLEVLDSGPAVAGVLAEVAALKALAPAKVHRKPHPVYSAAAKSD